MLKTSSRPTCTNGFARTFLMVLLKNWNERATCVGSTYQTCEMMVALGVPSRDEVVMSPSVQLSSAGRMASGSKGASSRSGGAEVRRAVDDGAGARAGRLLVDLLDDEGDGGRGAQRHAAEERGHAEGLERLD